ncbi:hypothetical protein PPGU19_086760 (plasmid) [Paraburkholderia sp. PGU19]|uniref:hypothetical protein n=1 Tax=Paraburkholderia sp. PGU19 TaxID=2735434 RepID=UPI0015DB8EF2|nr:hypothetical protein [Paraburkholderia sp. PGU19]BCG04108.1 hypothetical protein PPGU19_086760 [Paraburkholderia sp. PGU19]
MDKRKYVNHADAVFTVFEMLRKELAAGSDDSLVLSRLHEIASLPAADFFAALGDLATGLPAYADPSDVLSRCTPLPSTLAQPLAR